MLRQTAKKYGYSERAVSRLFEAYKQKCMGILTPHEREAVRLEIELETSRMTDDKNRYENERKMKKEVWAQAFGRFSSLKKKGVL